MFGKLRQIFKVYHWLLKIQTVLDLIEQIKSLLFIIFLDLDLDGLGNLTSMLDPNSCIANSAAKC